MEQTATTTVGVRERYTITIPQDVRNALELDIGDILEIDIKVKKRKKEESHEKTH